tara:strand:+ start:3387 stop:3644 length:258 start_codon:yes stop_codon:yes gene_type:complete
MIDIDKGQIEFDDVLREIVVGWDISEGNYDILRYYRDEYKDLLIEVERLREENKILATYMDIVQKYDEALSADGDTDPRWSELYD